MSDFYTKPIAGASKGISIPTDAGGKSLADLTVSLAERANVVTIYTKGDLAESNPIGAYTLDPDAVPSATDGQPIYVGDAIDVTLEQFDAIKLIAFTSAIECWTEQFDSEQRKT